MKYTRTLTLLALTLLFSYKSNSQERTSNSTEIKQFENLLDKHVPNLLNTHKVPGLALAIVDESGVLVKKGYGYADVAKQKPVKSTTGFNIGSVSKLFTAWAIMQLVTDDKIKLDNPVESYLSRWQIPVSEFDKSKVTIRSLLSHTAGLSVHGYPGYQPGEALPTLEESLNGNIREDERVFIKLPPQTKWKYSGGGYTILQLLIEEISGKAFMEYMESELFSRMKMKQTSFDINANILKKSAKPYNEEGNEIKLERFTAQAAAGLHTNLDDMIVFAQNNLNESELLSEKIKSEMRIPIEITNGRYGLGYGYFPVGPGKFVVGHAGSNDGWEAAFMIDPSDEQAIILLSNGSNGKKVLMEVLKRWIQWKAKSVDSQ